MKFVALLTALIGCAAASSEKEGFPLQEGLRAPTLSLESDAANNPNNVAPTARDGGLTVSRRITTATQVFTESDFIAALGNGAVIELKNDIMLTASIDIVGIKGLAINGNNFKVDGGGDVVCFWVNNGAEVTFNDLTITNCDGGVKIGDFTKRSNLDSTATFTSCPFTSNHARGGKGNNAPNGVTSPNGGAVSIEDSSTATFTSCPFTFNKALQHGGAVFITNDSTATFTNCLFTSNESVTIDDRRGRGGAINLYHGTLNLIGYSFSGNTAVQGNDIFQYHWDFAPTTLNIYSLCSGDSFSAGTGSLGCSGCLASYPADLRDAYNLCNPCDDDTSSCCGATACSASAPSCSAAELEICNWSPTDDTTPAPLPGGTCFHGSTQVTFEDKTTKAMTELQVGDKIQTADIHGNLDFASVISLPHKPGNSEMATFLKIVTDSGKSVQMTPGHLIPNCAGKMFSANEVAVGDCIMTVDGKEVVFEITSATHFGVYTAVTAHALIVTNGIIASPFSVENDPHDHNDGISSLFVYFINKMSAMMSTGLRGAEEPSNF